MTRISPGLNVDHVSQPLKFNCEGMSVHTRGKATWRIEPPQKQQQQQTNKNKQNKQKQINKNNNKKQQQTETNKTTTP